MGNQGSQKAFSECDVPNSFTRPVYEGDYSFNTGLVKDLTLADYSLFAAAFLLCVAFGAYRHVQLSRHRLGLEAYLLAGRSLGAVPIGISLVANATSAATFMAIPVNIHRENMMGLYWLLPYLLVTLVTSQLFIPVFYHLGTPSMFEYLERRFNKHVRLIAAIISIIEMSSYTAAVLYGISRAVHIVSSFNLWASIMAVGSIAVICTTMGGMKTVVWTQVYQFGAILISLIIVITRADLKLGGLGVAWDALKRTGRQSLLDFRLDPTVRHTGWSIVVGGTILLMSSSGMHQVQIQRCLSCKSLTEAKIALWLGLPIKCLLVVLSVFVSMFAVGFYEHCDPVRAGFVQHYSQIFSLFTFDILGDWNGQVGIALVAAFSLTYCCVSSNLMSLATVTLEELVRPLIKDHIREIKAKMVAQWLCGAIGIICLEMTLMFASTKDIIEVALNVGSLATPILGVFSLGLFFPWTNSKGAVAGLVYSFLVNVLLLMLRPMSGVPPVRGSPFCVNNCNITGYSNTSREIFFVSFNPSTHDEPDDVNVLLMSYLYLPLVALINCTVVGLLVSYVTGFQNPQKMDPRLIVPVADVLFPFYYLPESCRHKLRFGLVHSDKWQVRSVECDFHPRDWVMPVSPFEDDLKDGQERAYYFEVLSASETTIETRI